MESSAANVTTVMQPWIRPGLQLATFLAGASALDTALFDVDGVLIDTRRSYRYSAMQASEHLVRAVNGLTEAPSPMVSAEDIAAFKLAGGFNSDWDLTQLLAALWTAKLREWRGQPEARLTLVDWAEKASLAARERRGGLLWLDETVPASAIPDADTARWAHDEFYWGAELARKLYNHEPRFVPNAPGLVHNEQLLFTAELFSALAAQGINQFGLITGRAGAEVQWAIERLSEACIAISDVVAWQEGPYGRSPFSIVISADTYAKPDPRALLEALQPLDAAAALFVGDTADDLDLVLHYRQEQAADDGEQRLPVLAVCIAHGEQARIYQERGADIVIGQVSDLPEALATIR